eukprot:scaffold5382_cov114-Isochrysis_galbana.AAC.1
MQTDRQQQQAASRQGHTPFSTTAPTTPPQRARNGGMAANLIVRELPAMICDLLPSTAAIEQQRRTRRQPTFAPNFVFAVRAEQRCFVFYLARCQGDTPSQPKHY